MSLADIALYRELDFAVPYLQEKALKAFPRIGKLINLVESNTGVRGYLKVRRQEDVLLTAWLVKEKNFFLSKYYIFSFTHSVVVVVVLFVVVVGWLVCLVLQGDLMKPRSYQLTYFDLRARGELSRMLFAVAGVDYEDKRYPIDTTQFPFAGREAWFQERKENPDRYAYGQMVKSFFCHNFFFFSGALVWWLGMVIGYFRVWMAGFIFLCGFKRFLLLSFPPPPSPSPQKAHPGSG